MKVSIIGLPNSGKTTIFNAITGQNRETARYQTSGGEPHIGIIQVPDERLDSLTRMFTPRKTTHAVMDCVDSVGLTKGDLKQNIRVFDLIKDSDAIVHVVRAFHDDSVPHPLGENNPLRDIETIALELIFGDMELVEKRLERIKEGQKHGKKPDESETSLLLKCKDALSRDIPLRDAAFSDEELRSMSHLQFLSTVPVIIVLNFGEEDVRTNHLTDTLSSLTGRFPSLPLLALCGKIEMEIAQLTPEDRKPFLDEMGLDIPASRRLVHECFRSLGLISFFTYAGNEVRSWTIKKGTPAQKAAGKVHTDIERGFIRAEVISFDNLIASGSIQTAREKGLLRLEGKTYEVSDGDVINFRFNV